jgi:hypothetical protein
MISTRLALSTLLVLSATVACSKSGFLPGRCDKASDCQGGLTCDDQHTCVPTSGGQPACANDAQCGQNYVCDSLHWCICAVPNASSSASQDPCANGTLPPYRGVTTDGGIGDGGGDAGDGGFVCHSSGECTAPNAICDTTTNACVQCTKSSDCTVATNPICHTTTNTCVPCTTDAQCVAKAGANPGVCMFHQDGHCATSDETVYVQQATNLATCPAAGTANAGSSSLPFCQINQALAAAGTRRLIVVRGDMIPSDSISAMSPLSIVGQNGATIRAAGGAAGLHVTGTDTYIRGVQIFGGTGTDVGIAVDGGATIRLDGIWIDSMAKGGLWVTNSGYDVVNSIFSNNGGTQVSTGLFIGGVLLDTPPSGSLSHFAFNTVIGSKEAGVICAASTQTIDASLLANNLGGGGMPDYSGCTLSTSKALGSADPMLTTTFRLTGSSPCVDQIISTDLSFTPPDHDIDGVLRPQGSAYDCGASELVQP